MKARLKIAAPLMLATTAALAATGFATRAPEAPAAQASVTHPYVAPGSESRAAAWFPASEPQAAAPASAVQPAAPATEGAITPRRNRITVTVPRPSDDELLRNAVLERLGGDSRLAGRIGVEAYRHTVSLTGRVTTTGQVDRAESLAKAVDGVWHVDNNLMARVGQS